MNEQQFNRYADTQHTFKRSKDSITRLRTGLNEWLKDLNPTHYVTINFHSKYSMEKAEKLMHKWYDFVHRRLYKQCPEVLPEEKRIKLLGYPEYTLSGHIHYHCFARLPLDRADWFCQIAEPKFKGIVPTGTLHIRPFDGTDVGLEKAAGYTTKSNAAVEWYVPEHQLRDDVNANHLLATKTR